MPNNIFDCSTRRTTWLPLIVVPFALSASAYAPESWEFENGVLENLQMLLLALCLMISLTAKINKALFLFVASAILLLMLREVNCGRVLLWSTEGEMFHCGPPQDYLKWKHITHGSILRFAVYGIGVGLGLWALCRRTTFRQLAEVLRSPRIPLWETMMMLVASSSAVLAEKVYNCVMVEELGEVLAYAALAAFLYRYSRKNTMGCVRNSSAVVEPL